MARAKAPEFDLLELEGMASDPAPMKVWLMDHPEFVCDALGVDRKGVTGRAQLRALASRALRKIRTRTASSMSPTMDEVEEAIPGRMSEKAFAEMLAGGPWRKRGRSD